MTGSASLGEIDILVNNATLHLTKYSQLFSVLPPRDLCALLAVNVVGVVNCSLACRESMRRHAGGYRVDRGA
jgi:NAD(P)-dependent dehydrogenase (short-subunit alcohol dehydrogenase family)